MVSKSVPTAAVIIVNAQPSSLTANMVTGAIQVPTDATAYSDFLAAYAEIKGRAPGAVLPAMEGVTLTPGLYTAGAATGLAANTSVTLDGRGDANAVFVFQVNGALAMGAGAKVKVTGRAQLRGRASPSTSRRRGSPRS